MIKLGRPRLVALRLSPLTFFYTYHPLKMMRSAGTTNNHSLGLWNSE